MKMLNVLMINLVVIFSGFFAFEKCPENKIILSESRAFVDDVEEGVWALNNIGIQSAWNINSGSEDVSVAIIDSGIEYNHIDLSSNVDLQNCFDFYTNSNNSNSILDYAGHGTHVAGIIGATGVGNVNIKGVCQNVNLISYKVMSAVDSVSATSLVPAIERAQDNNIKIINMSIYFNELPDGLIEAIENYDGLIVLAAGNTTRNLDLFSVYTDLSALENVIIVGSSNSNNEMSTFSNYGSNNVDLFAPGDNIKSTHPYLVNQNWYAIKSGTSMAAPFVSGVAALILSEHPNISISKLKNQILNSVRLIPSMSDKCVSGGILNAASAVIKHDNYSVQISNGQINNRYHRFFCNLCDEYRIEPHVVENGNNICLYCGAEVQQGIVQFSFEDGEIWYESENCVIIKNKEFLSEYENYIMNY